MRNKKLIALAAALALTVQTGFATNISGVTGTNGVYNINPEAIKGTTGFRHYENFYLSQQDIANLIMKYGTKDLGTFINMVDNKVNIQGILNTMRNGEFAPGHAVFISPKGMVVGASGVLNVGSLSVLTPTDTKYNKLKNDISSIDLSALKEEANGDILIRGKVFARGDVNLQGANVAIPESAVIMNGAASNVALKSQEEANTLLFNSLVNTDKLMAGSQLANKDGKIVIRAAGKDGMLNVRGDVYNNNKGNITLTNEKGADGLKVTSTIKNVNGEIILNNNAGKTLVKGDIVNNGGFILLTDNGKGIHLNSGSNLTAQTGGLKIENNGSEGLAMYGNVQGLDGDVSIQNNKGKLYVAGNVDYKGTGEFQIINNAQNNSQLMVAKSASVNSSKDIYMKNKGDNGLYINSEMKAGKNLTLDNQAGDLTINNKITSGTGSSLMNSGNKLAISSKGVINNSKGNLVIKNTGDNGMLVYGTVNSNGDTISLTNDAGNLIVNGNVIAKSGNIGIINNGSALNIKENGSVNNVKGKTNIINYGEDGLAMNGKVSSTGNDLLLENNDGNLYVAGNVDYKGTGNFQIINNAEDNSQLMIAKSAQIKSASDVYAKNKGENGLFVNGTVNAGKNLTLDNQAGDLTLNNNVAAANGNLNLMNSGDKLAVSSKSTLNAKGGNLVLKNTGNKGTVIYGTLQNEGEAISLTNDAGDLIVNGNVVAKTGNIGIINNGSALNIKENASINNVKGKTNIVNYGEDGLAMKGKVSSTGSDLFLENNDGDLYVAGNVDYKGAGNFQIINNAEDNSQLMIAKTSKIKSTSDVYAKNKAQGGLFVNGTIDAANNLTLDNQAGDLTLNNNVSVANGNLNLMNSGDKLAISSKSTVSAKGGNLVVKNTGDNGTVIYGTLENEGDTISVTNNAGDLIVNGKVNAKAGNVGIINRGDQLYLKDKSVVNNAQGKTNIINSGSNGMKAIGRIDVNDELNIYNEDGQAYIDGYVISNGGDINILSRYNSDGVYVRQNAHVTNLPRIESDKVGTVTIKDTAVAGGSGVIIKGTVDSMNDIVVRSTDNNVYTNGKINAANAVNYSITAKNGQMTFGKETEITAATESYKLTNDSILKDLRAKGSQINNDNIHYIVNADEEI